MLARDLLLVGPVRHVMRGVCYWSGGSKHIPRVLWFMEPLREPPTPSRGLRLTGEISVGSSLCADFQEVMEERVRWAIDKFVGPVDTIQRLRDYAIVPREKYAGGFSALTLDSYPRAYAPVLAALGRLDEAQSVLRPALEKDEAHFRAMLEEGRALLAKRAGSGVGKSHVSFANFHLPILASLRHLLALIDAGDRFAIATLLHEWEHKNVTKWGIEHLWEATLFPLETAAGI